MNFTRNVYPTEHILDTLKALDGSFVKVDVDTLMAPQEVWDKLIKDLALPKDLRVVNGCGSKTTKFVPEKFWFLSVTCVCYIHDIMYEMSKDTEDCDQANITMLVNSIRFIDRNSGWIMQGIRNYRAVTYYNIVDIAKCAFCPGYKNDI